MSDLSGFKAADFGGSTSELENANGSTLFHTVQINWHEPGVWQKNAAAPIDEELSRTPSLYVITRDHHRSNERTRIKYIGITIDPRTRFNQHPKAKKILAVRGVTKLSVGVPDFGRYKTAATKPRPALEEIEHILIWALWHDLVNEKKQYTLPGLGINGGRAWHIKNLGYRFNGRMPREIIYPWMLLKPGRNWYTVRR